ncbi:MAG: hypothetical protein RLZZ427_925 [Pseudomonadota bacterium]
MPNSPRQFITAAATVLALAALPAAAHAAGSSSGSGTAALTVGDRCEISGNTVDFGTFLTTQTWGDVARQLGQWDGQSSYIQGTRGGEYLDFGSITCPALTDYTLNFVGDQGNLGAAFAMNGKLAQFRFSVKSIGGVPLADSPFASVYFPGAGRLVGNDLIPGTGTGAPQRIRGAAHYLNYAITTTSLTDPLTQGTYSHPLTYYLTF